MQVLKSIWLTNQTSNIYQVYQDNSIVGIIKAKDDHDNIYWYIGQCAGTDESTDTQFILQYGVKYSQDQIEYLKELFS